jgi:ribosome-binding protein aMBF1 (putative translation factor)
MENMEVFKMKNIIDFEDILKEKYGEKGTSKRDQYDSDSLAFRLGVMLKEARNQEGITQQELAERTGTKKSDIQISTFYKLIELGLGRHLNISIG